MTKTLAAKDDVFFDFPTMQNFNQSPQLVILPHGHWDVSIILALMTYTEWKSRWKNVGVNWDSLQSDLDCLRSCLMSGCDLESLVDTLNGLLSYEGKSITQILSELSVGPAEDTRITLKQYFDSFEADDKIQYAPIYGMLGVLSDILPDSLQENYKIEDPADFTAKLIDSLLSNAINLFQTGVQAVSAGAETGELAADAIDTVGTSLDTIFSGITAGALSFSAIADLIGLFKSGNTPPSDGNPDLRANVRVLNNVFVENGAICAPDVNVNCGGGSYQVLQGDTTTTEWADIPEVVQPDVEGSPPEGFSSWEEYFTYKCTAANYVFDGYINTLRNFTAFEGVVGGITLGAIVALLLIAVPPVGIAVLMVAIGAIAAYDLSLMAIFGTLSSDLEEQRGSIICELYNAGTTTEAIAALVSPAHDLLDGYGINGAIEQAFHNFIDGLVTHKTVAPVLGQEKIEFGDYEQVTDCDTCSEQPIVDGTFTASEHHSFTYHDLGGSTELFSYGDWWTSNTTVNVPSEAAIERDLVMSGENTIKFGYNVDEISGSNPNDITVYIDVYEDGSWVNKASEHPPTMTGEEIDFTGTIDATKVRFRVAISQNQYRVYFWYFDIN